MTIGHSKGRSALLWTIAFLTVLGAATWQRRTGPSYPLRGSFELQAGREVRYGLVRNENTDRDATVSIPHDDGIGEATLHFRRHGTGDNFQVVVMERTADEWRALLPRQPAAGKLDYFLMLNGAIRLPDGASQVAVIRFKDPVPAAILIPHILMMFVSMLCGVRAAMAAFLEPEKTRRLAWVTLGCLTVGGLFLGPVVQKYAFGAYWTGWPVGEDLTDTKTLVMWAGWALAVAVLGLTRPINLRSRVAVLFAVVVMIAVYLVPHSLRGSTLDYEKLEEGVRVEDAIKTG